MFELSYFFVYLMLGAFAGTAAGMLGIGGGLIIVPVLVWIFQQQGMSSNILVHVAIGTSLASIVFTSIASVRAHHQNNAVLWSTFRKLILGIIIGAWFGAMIADVLPTKELKLLFGLFELYVAVQMSLNIKPKAFRQLPNTYALNAVGVGIGFVSSIVGIGGGTLTVPFLVWCNTSLRKAIATSAAVGLPIAVAGSVGFVFAGWNEPELSVYSVGYVYFPALVGIILTSILFAPLGASLAHRLPIPLLKKIFALLLYVLSAKMLLS